MSEKHGAHPAGADDHGHDAFDPEPVVELGADETPSPGWLPIVGAVLFTLGVGFVFFPGADAIAKAPEPAPTVAPAVKPAAPAKTEGAAKRAPKRPDGKQAMPKAGLKKLAAPKK